MPWGGCKGKSTPTMPKSPPLALAQAKFQFTPTSITKLITATLKHKPYRQPHKKKTQAWKAITDDVNNATGTDALLTYTTAHKKIDALLDIRRVSFFQVSFLH